MDSRFHVILGHYGCGKTNLTLNLALDAVQKGQKVTVVDMDIVNPYFRSADYRDTLENKGIRLIAPRMAGTTLDSPSLSAEIFSVFHSSDTVFFDVGGDDAGAESLGRFRSRLEKVESIEVLYVINRFRPIISTPQGAVDILREIEKAGKIKATALVNNSHLCQLTTKEDIEKGYEYALKVEQLSGLPLLFTTVPKGKKELFTTMTERLYEVDTIVELPFNV